VDSQTCIQASNYLITISRICLFLHNLVKYEGIISWNFSCFVFSFTTNIFFYKMFITTALFDYQLSSGPHLTKHEKKTWKVRTIIVVRKPNLTHCMWKHSSYEEASIIMGNLVKYLSLMVGPICCTLLLPGLEAV